MFWEKKGDAVISVNCSGREKRVEGFLDGSYEDGRHYEYTLKKKKQTVEVVGKYPEYRTEKGRLLIGACEGNTTAVPMYGEKYDDDPGDAVMAIHTTHIATKVVKAMAGGSDFTKWIVIAGVVLIAIYIFSRLSGSSGGAEINGEPVAMLIGGLL